MAIVPIYAIPMKYEVLIFVFVMFHETYQYTKKMVLNVILDVTYAQMYYGNECGTGYINGLPNTCASNEIFLASFIFYYFRKLLVSKRIIKVTSEYFTISIPIIIKNNKFSRFIFLKKTKLTPRIFI